MSGLDFSADAEPALDFSGEAEPVQPRVSPLRAAADLASVPIGVGEAALNAGSSMVAPVAGGLAGIGELATNALGLTSTPAADVVQNVGGALTYEPRTPIGTELSDAFAYPFKKLAEGGRYAGEHVLDATGSTVAATTADTAVNALPLLLGARAARTELPRAITPEMVDEFMARSRPAAPDFSASAEPIYDAEFTEIPRPALPPPQARLAAEPNELTAALALPPPAPAEAPLSAPSAEQGAAATLPITGGRIDVPAPEAQPPRAPEPVAPNEPARESDTAGAVPGNVVPINPEAPSVNQTPEPTVEVPIDQIGHAPEVPQFKEGSDAEGVVEPLGGKYDRRGTGPIQLWRRLSGALHMISGRHRLRLAKDSGETTIPAQVYNESDGFDARHAASLDAELNIRDGQGKVKDYVSYFQNNPGLDKAEAESRGLLARATGKRAYAIASEGDAELIAAHRADQITDEAAVQIAHAAPNNARLQALGMKLVQEGKPIGVAANAMRAVQSMGAGSGSGDMFGFDDSAIQDAVKMAGVATRKQREISERLAAITGAAKRPELARKEGIDVRDPKALPARIAQLRLERDAWENWATDPAKIDEIRGELGMRTEPEPERPEPEPDEHSLSMFGNVAEEQTDMFGAPTTAERIRAAQEAKDAERNGLAGGKADTGDGGLFDGERPEQTRVPDRLDLGRVEQRVFHGTPHRGIEKEGFKLNKIGTGEGAQAYGYGVYFAGKKEIAEHYRTALSGADNTAYAHGPTARMQAIADAEPGRYAVRPDDGPLGNGYAYLVMRKGQLYHAEIPEDHDLLDWDKPLSEQPERVRNALDSSGMDWEANSERETGAQFYNRLAKEYGSQEEASKILDNQGIPGLRYLDGSSRNAGEGSRNYVIWDEAHLNKDVTPYYVGEQRGAASRDMFGRTRGDLAHEQDQARNGRQDNDSRPAAPAGDDAGGVRLRPDATPELARRGKYEIESLVRRNGGSVLGDTLAREFRETDVAQLVGKTIKSPQDLAALASVYRNPHFEVLRYIFTDDAGTVLGETAVSARMASTSPAMPSGIKDGRAWLKSVTPDGATRLWCMHNHPSGNPAASFADRRFTADLAKEIRHVHVRGHVVLNHEHYSYIGLDGLSEVRGLPSTVADPLREATGFPLADSGGQPDDIARLGKALYALTPDDSVAVITTNAKLDVVSAVTLPTSALTGKRGAALLHTLGIRGGGQHVHLVMSSELADRYSDALDKAADAGFVGDVIRVDPDGKATSSRSWGSIGSTSIKSVSEDVALRKGKPLHAAQVYEATTDYEAPEPTPDRPARRPGESQQAYARRVMRKGRDETKEATALAKRQQKIGRANFREFMATQARAMDIADAAFAEARKVFDKTPEAINLATIDQWETGAPVKDIDAREFFANMQEGFDQRIAKIRALAPDALQQLIEHYFPHMWEDSAKASKWYQGFMAKRPLEGNKAFLKQRTWGTIKEGMASGLKPVSTNPVDLALLKFSQMDKFIAFHELRDDLDKRGWLKSMKAGERVPEGFARVDDPAFQKAGGLQGYYAVPELIAKDINGYLAPSLYRFGAWKALRTVQNLLMSSRLGWSMFHMGFTTMDNVVMHAATSVGQFMHGNVVDGLTTLLKAPLTVVLSPLEGNALNQQWRGLRETDPHTAALLNLLEKGGARFKMSPTDYNNALPRIIRSVRQKALGKTIKDILPAAGEASSWIIHHWLVPNQKMAARVMLLKFELDRFAEKLGKERGDYAGIVDVMHPDVAKQIAGKVVNVVDDRLGQMTYDNQFWNKTARELSQAVIGAVGWQVGTVRTVTGGVRDLQHLWNPEELVAPLDKEGTITGEHLGRVSGRLTYLLTLALTMGGLGALTQYLLTGEGPSEVKDYFFPKTGRRNADDSPERLQYPTYWMDHYKLATHPLQTAGHKIHPSIGMFIEAINNQDFYGVRIRNQDAPWYKQAEQVGKYVAKGFVPYSFTSSQKARANDAGIDRMTASVFGVVNAPASVSRSEFQAFVAGKAASGAPKGARTQESADRTNAMHAAEDELRRGKEPDFGDLSAKDQKAARRAAEIQVPEIRFRRLGLEDKLRAYDMATPEERERYHLRAIILRVDPSRSSVFERLPDEEKRDVMARIRAIAKEPAAIGTEP